MSEATPVLDLDRVTTGYDRHPVVESASLRLSRGAFLALIGPNGGGKTTLLKAILGLLPVWSGSIRIVGRPVRSGRRHVGYVPQGLDFDRDFPIRVRDVVRQGRLGPASLWRGFSKADRRLADDALAAVGLDRLANRALADLSGGQRQRVFIARALATQPDLLLLDEPTAQADPEARATLFDLLRDLRSRLAIVLVTHDVGAVSEYVTQIGCLNRQLHLHHGNEITPDLLTRAYGSPTKPVQPHEHPPQ